MSLAPFVPAPHAFVTATARRYLSDRGRELLAAGHGARPTPAMEDAS